LLMEVSVGCAHCSRRERERGKIPLATNPPRNRRSTNAQAARTRLRNQYGTKGSGILPGCLSARRKPMSNPKLKFVVGGVVIVGALAYLGFVGIEQSKSYYITVSEYRSMESKLAGKTCKVAGDVVVGSIDRSKRPLEFTIGHEGQTLRVQYVGRDVIPDTF